MRADDGRIDHGVLVVGVIRQFREEPFPDPRLGRARVPAVDVLPAAEAFGEIAPGDSGPVAVDDGFHEEAVVAGGDADGAVAAGQ